MTDDPPVAVDSDGLPVEDRIDIVCDAFEREWLAGRRPRIEDYLRETVGPERSTLLVELVRVDMEYRSRSGETPRSDEYAWRFPEAAERLRDPDLVGTLSADLAGTPQSPHPDDTTPRSFAHFELLQKLGEGAFGSVWKARDTRLDRVVAVKVPRGAFLDSGEADILRREGRAAAQLRHPNIVSVYEIGRDAGTAYIVSEYIDGISLKDWLSRRRPTPRESAELCAKLADALHHAHERGIVHRDLKPANIIIDRDGEPHIADFGLAKRIESDGSITADGQVLGTPAYMSPEQAAGDSNRVDARSDVYGLGVIFYELLTGERPFRGDNRVVLNCVLTQEPTPPHRVLSDVPADLEAICLKAMARDSAQRYAGAAELAEDLRRALRGEAVRARRPGRWPRVRRWSRREFAAALSSAAGLAGLSLASGYFGRRYFASGAWNPAASEFGPRPVTLSTRPEGARVVFVPLNGRDGTPRPERMVEAGRSPVSIELLPGDYWVVVDLDGYEFHEVLRRVPLPDERRAGWFRHQKWMEHNGRIELRTIEIPRLSVHEGMVPLAGGADLRMGNAEVPGSIVHHRTVHPFLLEKMLFTVADYRRISGGALPNRMAEDDPDDNQPIVMISYDEAVHLSELSGKRLPDEWEYESAIAPREEEPFEERPLAASPVAVWTTSWPNQPPYDAAAGSARTGSASDLRVVRGASYNALHARSTDSPRRRSPLVRHAVLRSVFTMRGLGFRCARSAKPRLQPNDWVVSVR